MQPEEIANKIKEEGLLACLSTEDGLDSFYAYLKTEFAEENLDFWLAVERFRDLDDKKKEREAVIVYDDFIHNKAPRKINITFMIRDPIDKAITNGKITESMFDGAQQAALKLMKQNNWTHFVSSTHFAALVSRRVAAQEAQEDDDTGLFGRGNKKKATTALMGDKSYSSPEALDDLLMKLKTKGTALKQGTKPNKDCISFTFCFKGSEFLNWCKAEEGIDRARAKKIASMMMEGSQIYPISNLCFEFDEAELFHLRGDDQVNTQHECDIIVKEVQNKLKRIHLKSKGWKEVTREDIDQNVIVQKRNLEGCDFPVWRATIKTSVTIKEAKKYRTHHLDFNNKTDISKTVEELGSRLSVRHYSLSYIMQGQALPMPVESLLVHSWCDLEPNLFMISETSLKRADVIPDPANFQLTIFMRGLIIESRPNYTILSYIEHSNMSNMNAFFDRFMGAVNSQITQLKAESVCPSKLRRRLYMPRVRAVSKKDVVAEANDDADYSDDFDHVFEKTGNTARDGEQFEMSNFYEADPFSGSDSDSEAFDFRKHLGTCSFDEDNNDNDDHDEDDDEDDDDLYKFESFGMDFSDEEEEPVMDKKKSRARRLSSRFLRVGIKPGVPLEQCGRDVGIDERRAEPYGKGKEKEMDDEISDSPPSSTRI
eukprot:TRINITY_DN9557_c0_g1_i1.p1 TRINITY_DN9557_c0_g1~~TRINITY_DN9557_c0_g1_i1.p1  ORF type:complete len:676 (-),score=146.30 TRINITY_DN9557_c0_g1_i1:107-2068(-)